MKKIKIRYFLIGIVIFILLIFISISLINEKNNKLIENNNKNINLTSKKNNKIQHIDSLDISPLLKYTNDNSKYVNEIIENHVNHVFTGTIDNKKITLVISRDNNKLDALYIGMDEKEPEAYLKGTIDPRKSYFILYDEKNKGSYIFVIDSSKHIDTLNGIVLTNLNKSIVGTPILLNYAHSMLYPLEDRYSLMGIKDLNPEDVENFAGQIKFNILNNKKEDLSKMIEYPIYVIINNKKVKIKTPNEFIKNYGKIITPKFKKKIVLLNIYFVILDLAW